MKIAIFGGSFDPFHKGHKEVIKEALKSLKIDRLIVVPTYLNPFKKEFFLDEKKRLKYVKNALKNFKKVKILDFEVRQKRAVSSYETILFLKKKYNLNKIYFIIGADNLKDLSKWYKYKKLSKMVEFVIAKRDNIFIPKKYKILNVKKNISSTKIRREKFAKNK